MCGWRRMRCPRSKIFSPSACRCAPRAMRCAPSRWMQGYRWVPHSKAFGARARVLAEHCLPDDTLQYDAGFGRPLDYYTGLVFELSVLGAERPLAGGGRYDRLLTLLGAEAPIPGVGFSVWLDRVAAARGDV